MRTAVDGAFVACFPLLGPRLAYCGLIIPAKRSWCRGDTPVLTMGIRIPSALGIEAEWRWPKELLCLDVVECLALSP